MGATLDTLFPDIPRKDCRVFVLFCDIFLICCDNMYSTYYHARHCDANSKSQLFSHDHRIKNCGKSMKIVTSP